MFGGLCRIRTHSGDADNVPCYHYTNKPSVCVCVCARSRNRTKVRRFSVGRSAIELTGRVHGVCVCVCVLRGGLPRIELGADASEAPVLPLHYSPNVCVCVVPPDRIELPSLVYETEGMSHM